MIRPVFVVLFCVALVGSATAAPLQGAPGAGPSADTKPLYYHAYRPVLSGSFQLQPGQGFSIVEPFGGFVRMVQVCVREAKSAGPMPVPTPMLATRRLVNETQSTGVVPVGSCVVIEGESIAVGLADGKVDLDMGETNIRRKLTLLSGTYTVLGYYSHVPPTVPEPATVR